MSLSCPPFQSGQASHSVLTLISFSLFLSVFFPSLCSKVPTNSTELAFLTCFPGRYSWESYFSGSAWTYDSSTDEYYLHLFAAEQPDLNWENPRVVEAVHKIIRFWLDRGVDGFRMDVINFISKEPGLPDGEVTKPGFLQSGIKWHSCGPRLHEFLKGIGAILKEYDTFSVGEMPGVTDAREIVKGVGQDRGELGMAFHFEM